MHQHDPTRIPVRRLMHTLCSLTLCQVCGTLESTLLFWDAAGLAYAGPDVRPTGTTLLLFQGTLDHVVSI